MRPEPYPLESNGDHPSFEFNSVGPKGIIKKIISFNSIKGWPGIYNLSLGDWDEVHERIKR
jgi:hypothetical protein